MKAEAQLIAIAGVCGWVEVKQLIWVGEKLDPTKQFMRGCGHLPNYLTDLNAMHEAEKVLTPQQCYLYQEIITSVFGEWRPMGGCTSWLWHATAAQRAEAFLRALGKWVDSPTA